MDRVRNEYSTSVAQLRLSSLILGERLAEKFILKNRILCAC